MAEPTDDALVEQGMTVFRQVLLRSGPRDQAKVRISHERLRELERMEMAVLAWRHCRVLGEHGVQLACDHDRKLAAVSRTAYRREHPTE